MHLTVIYKKSGWFFRVTHLVQKLIAKMQKAFFQIFKMDFHPSPVIGSEKF